MYDVISDFIELEGLNEDQFLKVKETLTRVGIKGTGKTLTQTAHVLHKNGRYYIVHFRQMFMLDGLCDVKSFTQEDRDRVESIAYLMNKWGLVKLVNAIESQKTFVYVIPFADKGEWRTRSNYTIGRKRI